MVVRFVNRVGPSDAADYSWETRFAPTKSSNMRANTISASRGWRPRLHRRFDPILRFRFSRTVEEETRIAAEVVDRCERGRINRVRRRATLD
jgi:hypothetical protein